MRVTRNDAGAKWMNRVGYRTYELAALLDTISRDPIAYARELEGVVADEDLYRFAKPWPKETLLHVLARHVAAMSFESDTDSESLHEVLNDEGPPNIRKWILPVDGALIRYGLLNEDEAFAVPYEIDEDYRYRFDEDAAWDYLRQQLMPSEIYDSLLGRIADEMFHILFHNRKIVAGLNYWASLHVRSLPEGGDKRFKRDGVLKRKLPPKWVKRAVYHREQGRCASCKTDLTGILSAVADDQFDHIVPLANGGLNDVTNIQLLCKECNSVKSDQVVAPSDIYPPRLIPPVHG